MATQTKQIKLDGKDDLDLYHQEAINIAKIAGKVGGLYQLYKFIEIFAHWFEYIYIV